MKSLRIINNFIKKRKVKQIICALIVLLLIMNCWFSLIYVSQNRNEIVYNRYFNFFLPIYRSAREINKTIVNFLYLGKMKNDVGIPQYKLEIDANDWKKLNDNLPDASSDGVISGQVLLTDEFKKTVPAKFIYQGKEYKVKVRYRGGNANHWTRIKKSWQIKFDKNNLFNGIKTIKLIIPDDRSYFAEYLNNYRAEKLGLFFPQAEYVLLKINGKNYGVYYQIEDWSKEFLEKNKLPSDANIYATDEANYHYDNGMSVFDDIKYWKKHTNDKIFNFSNYAELNFLINSLEQDNFGEIAPNIIDLDNFYRWQIVSFLAGSNHQGDGGNIRMYFNNSKGKFEFIPWDVVIKSYPADAITSKLANKILQTPKYLIERNRLLWQYINDKENLRDDLEFYDDIYNKIKPAIYADWKKHDSNLIFDRKVEESCELYKSIFNNIKDLFKQDNSEIIVHYNAEQKVIAVDFNIDNFSGLELQSIVMPASGAGPAALYYDIDRNRALTNNDKLLKIFNIADNKIVFNGINYFLYDISQFIEGKSVKFTNHTLFIKLDNAAAELNKIEFDLVNAVSNKKVKIKNITFIDDTAFSYFSKINLTPRLFVDKNKIFSLTDQEIILRRGNYYINQNIIVPKNTKLKIEAGTVLRFAPNISLISYSPIVAQGTAMQPIIFQAADIKQAWGAIGILNCGDKKSSFENVRVSNGNGAYINGIFFSGMLSSYHSDIELKNSIIEKSNSDDGLNVKYAQANIFSNQFIGNSADAIDIDYSNGIIENNYFKGNGNDSIDLSGSKVLIKNNNIIQSGDKCISIGEKSDELVIFNNILNGCKVGIETKDASVPVIINNIIINNEIGLNAYRKKEIFQTGGFPKVYNSIIWGNKQQIKDDEFSKTEIYYSDIENGFDGEGNFNQQPGISAGKYKSFSRGGSIDILKQKLKVDIAEAPVGLFEQF